jgi:hypothetical protein
MPAVTGRPIQPDQALNVVSRSEGSPSPIPTANMLAPAAAPATNMLAPPPAAPANALAAPGMSAEEQRARTMLLSQNPGVRAAGQTELSRLMTLHTLAPGSSLRDASGRIIAQAPEKPPAPPTSAAEYELAQKDPNFMRFLQARAAATRQPVQPSPPVAIVGEDGRVKYVTREEALGKTPATAIEGLSPKDIQKREAVLPQARQSVKTVGNTMSVIGETVDRILANPEGLDGITGVIYGRTPALTDAARKANADLEQLKNLAFVQGLTELRAASKTGAGVGNVSNREGDRFENLKASLDRTQSKTDLEDSLRRLKGQAGFTSQSMQEAFDETYKYKQTAPNTQTPAAAPNIDALLQKYK